MENTKYCMCCDDMVPFSVIEKDEKRELQCEYCGFILDIQALYEPEIDVKKGYALIADDSKYTRKIIEDILTERKFSEYIISFENGAAIIQAYSKLLSENSVVDLAIIDLNMPVIDGLTAARTLRSLETKNNVRKVPIVFFSSKKADEVLKKHMEELKPAIYVNKTNDPDPDKLAKRVDDIVSFVLAKYKNQ